MEVSLYNVDGEEIGKVVLNDYLFGAPINISLIHQAVVRQQANRRLGTVATKTRGEVQGSTRKLYRQKGTGLARQGSRRAPHRVGGGIVFGPRPRDYRQEMPKKMRRAALRSALSAKMADGRLIVIDQVELAEARTNDMLRILENLRLSDSTLLVTEAPDKNIITAARNIPRVKTLPVPILNTEAVVAYNQVLMTLSAVRKAEAMWGGGA